MQFALIFLLKKKVYIFGFSCIFVFVPMMNPDGVILGNSRTGASGKDLNRQFRSKNKFLFPEVHLLKNMVSRLTFAH